MEQELEGLRYIGQIRLGGSLAICVSQLIVQWIDLPLLGRRKGFFPSSSVSSLITHRRVILYLHLSSLTLVLYFYCLLFMFMHQSSIGCLHFIYSHFRTQISQSKSNLAIIFNWGSKQALVFFNTFLSFQICYTSVIGKIINFLNFVEDRIRLVSLWIQLCIMVELAVVV